MWRKMLTIAMTVMVIMTVRCADQDSTTPVRRGLSEVEFGPKGEYHFYALKLGFDKPFVTVFKNSSSYRLITGMTCKSMTWVNTKIYDIMLNGDSNEQRDRIVFDGVVEIEYLHQSKTWWYKHLGGCISGSNPITKKQ